MNSYYDFNFDGIYNCKKVETAIERAKKDIIKNNGDENYLELDIESIKADINKNGKYELKEIGNFIVEVEELTELGQYYINLKYKN